MSPSLNDLISYMQQNPDKFSDLNLSVLEYYDKNENEYYLGGQILITKDTPITDELIEKVKNINSDSLEPCNMMEYISVGIHNERFDNIQKIIKRYLQYI